MPSTITRRLAAATLACGALLAVAGPAHAAPNSLGDRTVNEGATLTFNATTQCRTFPSCNLRYVTGPVAVSSLGVEKATAGADYVPAGVGRSVAFGGSWAGRLDVRTLQDQLCEGDERFSVYAISGGSIKATGTVTIKDDADCAGTAPYTHKEHETDVDSGHLSETCTTPNQSGALGVFGGPNRFIRGCTTDSVVCPRSSDGCTATSWSKIEGSIAAMPVTLNSRIRRFTDGSAAGFHDVSCAQKHACVAEDELELEPGQRATVECNGTRVNFIAGSARVICDLDVDF
jgi:hypothetical protein